MLQLFEANSNWSFTRFDVDAVPAFMALEQTTLAAVFLSLVLAVGIGFVVIRQCSTLGLILCTAPFLYVAMFFVIAPPLPALFCLLGAYVMVYVLQGSLKARWLPDKKQAKGQTVHEKALVQRSVALVALIAVILSAIAGVALLPMQGYERRSR